MAQRPWGTLVVAVVAAVVVPMEAKSPELHSQWLLGYDHGLVKRGLAGALLRGLVFRGDGRITTDSMLTATTVVALVALALFTLLAVQAHRARGAARGEVADLVPSALLLLTPVGALYLVSNSQYLEVTHLLLLAAYALVLVRRPPPAVGIPVLVATCVVATLLHESALVSVVPLVLVLHWLVGGARRDRGTIVVAGGTVVLCLAVVLAASAHSSAVADEAVAGVEARYPTSAAEEQETRDVLTRSVPDNVGYAFDRYRSVSGGGSRVVLSLAVAAPAMAFLGARLLARLGRRRGAVLLGATLAPLALCLIADDVYRWYVLVVVGMAVADLVLDVTGPRPRPGAGPSAAAGLLAMAVAGVLPYPYFLGNDGNPLSDPVLRILSGLEGLVT